MPTNESSSALPAIAGIGLRGPHLADFLQGSPQAGWLEVHAETYMYFGPAISALEKLRAHDSRAALSPSSRL